MLPFRGSLPPQIDAVTDHVDLITITIGGNDLGYIGSCLKLWAASALESRLVTRAFGRWFRDRAVVKLTEADYERTIESMCKVVEAARARAPKARILLVDYTTVFSDDSKPSPTLPFTEAEIARLRAISGKLDECFVTAADRSDATLVKASAVTKEHALGSNETWVIGAQRDRGSPFHPTFEAMHAIAEEIVRVLGV